MVLSIGILMVSIRCLWDVRSFVQAVAVVLVLSLVSYADMMLVMIALGAWPTYLPHLLIVATIPIVIWQVSRVIAKAG
jgi:hypothetical protein